jgi:hypothetical protein
MSLCRITVQKKDGKTRVSAQAMALLFSFLEIPALCTSIEDEARSSGAEQRRSLGVNEQSILNLLINRLIMSLGQRHEEAVNSGLRNTQSFPARWTASGNSVLANEKVVFVGVKKQQMRSGTLQVY